MMGVMWHMSAFGWVIFGGLMAIFWGIAYPALRARYHPGKRSAGQYASDQDPSELAELRLLADRLQARVDTLERLLDATQPDWRKR